MNKSLNRKMLMTIILLVCAGVLGLLAFRFFIMLDEGRNNGTGPTVTPPTPVPTASQSSGTQTKAISADNVALPTIVYRDHRFTPLSTTLKQNAKGTGCVIRIENRSDAPLVVRLSPHEKALKGNYGGQYDPIPPGKSIIIDPRFDMGYESFHNFNAPGEEFHVTIGNSCRSDL